MTLIEILPIIVAIVIIFTAFLIMRGDGEPEKHLWVVPAVFCVLFSAWTLGAMVTEGPTAFWPEHTRNMWGNQIWFDLLLAICAGWFFIVPKAKAVGMKLPIWFIFVIFTGSVGMTAMLARFLYLHERNTQKS